MKYVIDDHDNVVMGGKSSVLYHEDLFKAFGPGSRIKSAGHCAIVAGKVEVRRGSIGFGIESKPEDAEIIGAYLGI